MPLGGVSYLHRGSGSTGATRGLARAERSPSSPSPSAARCCQPPPLGARWRLTRGPLEGRPARRRRRPRSTGRRRRPCAAGCRLGERPARSNTTPGPPTALSVPDRTTAPDGHQLALHCDRELRRSRERDSNPRPPLYEGFRCIEQSLSASSRVAPKYLQIARFWSEAETEAGLRLTLFDSRELAGMLAKLTSVPMKGSATARVLAACWRAFVPCPHQPLPR